MPPSALKNIKIFFAKTNPISRSPDRRLWYPTLTCWHFNNYIASLLCALDRSPVETQTSTIAPSLPCVACWIDPGCGNSRIRRHSWRHVKLSLTSQLVRTRRAYLPVIRSVEKYVVILIYVYVPEGIFPDIVIHDIKPLIPLHYHHTPRWTVRQPQYPARCPEKGQITDRAVCFSSGLEGCFLALMTEPGLILERDDYNHKVGGLYFFLITAEDNPGA
jgi:hypothetical protein